ncbi:MAG: hypothetical protein V7K97_29600 [Nostoc sp.]|uniref:hypothetical protein n=1 Tax=Nostoc sp. TaxID=1180 RepID=UPI002FF8F599
MKKLQLDEVAFRKSEGCFPGIFNQTFGLIRLIEPILIKGNQMALKFVGISSSKVIGRPLWAVWRL